jgi:hypothetical protein
MLRISAAFSPVIPGQDKLAMIVTSLLKTGPGIPNTPITG